MYKYLIILMLLAVSASAADLTPYNIYGLRSSHDTDRDTSVTFYAERLDRLSHFGSLGPAFFDSILDTAAALGKIITAGPYASTHEISFHIGTMDTTTSYETRLLDSTNFWQYINFKAYLDSVGKDMEDCICHIAETSYTITNDGLGDGKNRIIDRADTLDKIKRRQMYQYMGNSPGDSLYPCGMQWIFWNGDDTCLNAMAYAFVKRFTDSVWRHAVDGVDGSSNLFGPWTGAYSDNQQRSSSGGAFYQLLDSYWSPSAYAGGPSGGYDWMELNDIFTEANATTYFDGTILPLDSAVKFKLDSTYDANSWERIRIQININWWGDALGNTAEGDLDTCLPFASGVHYEGPIEPNKGTANYRDYFNIHHTMKANKNKRVDWYLPFAGIANAYFSDDTARSMMASYCFYLCGYDTNSFFCLEDFQELPNWRDIYYYDMGMPDDSVYLVDSIKSGFNTLYIWRTNFSDTSYIVLFMTADDAASQTDDTLRVNVADGLENTYYEIDINADSSAADSTFKMYPYMGKVLATAAPASSGQRFLRIRK